MKFSSISEISTNSVDLADAAGKSLQIIVPGIEKTADLVREISASSKEQDDGAGQIARSIQELDSTIQRNASASEEMAATSEELSQQAEQLMSRLEYFKTRQVRSLDYKVQSDVSQADYLTA